MKNISDAELYKKCQEYGSNARIWLRKFAGLLPEVYRRHLYKKRGFGSIHEFGAKLGGMSHETVDKVLRLSQKLADKPALLNQLETGDQGWSKIETVAFIATPETDREWAKKVEILSKESLEKYVSEIRKQSEKITPGSNSENIQEIEQEAWPRLSLEISPEVENKLKYFKQQLEKERKESVSWNEVMLAFLDQKEKLKQEPKRIIKICPECTIKNANTQEKENPKRYIPVSVKTIVNERYKTYCAFPACNKPPEIYHHVRRFALRKNHDPEFIKPLCKAHERLAHYGLIENEKQDPETWRIREVPDETTPEYQIDKIVQKFRRPQTANIHD